MAIANPENCTWEETTLLQRMNKSYIFSFNQIQDFCEGFLAWN